jgi:hypothetical protein
MSVTKYPYWLVETRYDRQTEDHWKSQSRLISIGYNLGIRYSTDYKWDHGSSTPKGWNGYTVDNPSPGYDIDRHYWRFFDEDQAFTFYLACGSSIRKVEDPNVSS